MAKKTESNGKKMSEAQAAEFLLPQAGVKYIKDEFGIDITTQKFSATKSQQKTRRNKPKGGVDPVGIKRKPSANGSHSSAALAEAVKKLVAGFGTVEVGNIMKVFSD